ncbi:transposase [Anaeromyxobacter diazotrophicus]|nr:transposase [Anaeromyxobacter diazotrophicus]
MKAPRQVLPGTTYLVTRRCSQRQFLLRPSKTTNAIFLYVLAVATRRFGMKIHAFCVLSNHFHLVLTDPSARLPAFEQYLDSLVARAINATLGRWESFWAPSSYSAVALASPADIVDKTAYVLANPVAAGLVRRARDWPGLWSAPALIGGASLHAVRPAAFFRDDGSMPPTAELQLVAPEGFESPVAFRDQVTGALVAAEARAGSAVERRGRGFLGRARVLSQNPLAQPATGEPRRQLNPRVASRDKWKRVETLARLLEFVERYRAARRARRAGQRDALFPPGTYLLRIAHGVACAPA